ncbi:MAG: cytochrome c oxidase subunit II [Alphaproteobacteria bacterium]|nr:cytochrome c oxidase subunit II [Alphaproteobacteria bacterium]MBV8548514.1 cytochrome c oxidase subunit II [Alphaproteobacteria bacterium]
MYNHSGFAPLMRRIAALPRFGLALMATMLVLLGISGTAFADGVPAAWGIGLQAPASPVADYVAKFHDVLLVLITVISAFVLVLLIYVVARYNKKANPVPSAVAHNVKLEVIWTLVPALILAVLFFVYSMPLLYYSDRASGQVDLTLKVTGHQWYWSYEYPDNNGISFDSHAIWDSSTVTDEDAAKLVADAQTGWLIKNKPLRLLEVDNRVVLPVGKMVRVLVAGSDVEHSWYVPAVAVNRMSVPGHVSELWIKLDHEGLFYGQCSMICGNGHGYMPIVIEGVSPDKFAAWTQNKKSAAATGIYLNAPQLASIEK